MDSAIMGFQPGAQGHCLTPVAVHNYNLFCTLKHLSTYLLTAKLYIDFISMI